MKAGENLDASGGLFQEALMRNCESLVRFDKVITSPGKKKELCTFWHGSLRRYFKDNPDVLAKHSRQEYLISSSILATGCVRYLQQPRYETLLSKVPGSFSTHDDEDILDHHFLNYCAKYWRGHMDDHGPSFELHTVVEKFVQSPNFFTCLQIQSLFVSGK
jgi:hypothetical protein